MKKLLPVLLVVFGLLAGAGAGLMLRPAPPPENCPPPAVESNAREAGVAPDTPQPTDTCADLSVAEMADPAGQVGTPLSAAEYVRLERQFVIPIISPDRVRALVVLSLSIETDSGAATLVYAQEPKLRDAFLQVLFRHANSGGFDGAFTTGQPMSDLRGALRAASREVLGPLSRDVLVLDVVRQDI